MSGGCSGANTRSEAVGAGCLAVLALLAALLSAPASVAPALAAEPDTVAPQFVSARTDSDGANVIVTFSEEIVFSPIVRYLREKYRVPSYRFPKAVMDVTVDGHNDLMTDYVFIRGRELWMSLSAYVTSGQEVKVAYDNVFAESGGGIFVDASGNAVPYFSFQAVENNSILSSGIDRTPDFVLSVDELTVEEGDSATYTVALVSQPSTDVWVNVISFMTLSTSVSRVAFTPDNWNTPQTVTVSTYTDIDPFDAWGVVHHYLEWQDGQYTATNEDYWVGINVLVEDHDAPLPVIGQVSVAYPDGDTASVASYTAISANAEESSAEESSAEESSAGESTVDWSLTGDDSDRFSISDSGVLSFRSPPAHGNPLDSNADNVYELFVDASTESSVGFLPVFVTVTAAVGQHDATGEPTISGTARVGMTLTADPSGITDADGTANAVFSYQWVSNDGAVDADIAGATGADYTLQASDEGKTIKVRVAFTDDSGNPESVVSGYTAPVVSAGGL